MGNLNDSCSSTNHSDEENAFPLSALLSLSPQSMLLMMTSLIVGGLVTLLWTVMYLSSHSVALREADDRRRRLPKTIILIRHGESEANVDKSRWKTVPDNLLGLTQTGKDQAGLVGRRVERILQQDQCRRVHLVVSPFERTLQTAAALRSALEHRVVRTDIESRIREQEMGNIQGDEFQAYRSQQKQVGRFWYRFPTGESGSDVFDRVKSWWFESVLTVNVRVGFEPIDAMVVITHGLTMRFILMQLFNWSPTTFHSVWNADNCDMYVLRKDLEKPGLSPYVMDKERGDVPRSSIDVMVRLKPKKAIPGGEEEEKEEVTTTTTTPIDNKNKNAGRKLILKLEDYLSVPPPRTTRIHLIKHMLAKQYPTEIPKAHDIASIVFMPFVDVEGRVIKGRSTSGVQHRSSTVSSSSTASSRSSSYCDEEVDTRLSSSHNSSSSSSPAVVLRRGESTASSVASTLVEKEQEEEEYECEQARIIDDKNNNNNNEEEEEEDNTQNQRDHNQGETNVQEDEQKDNEEDNSSSSSSSSSSYHGDQPIRLARQEESRRWSYFQIPGLTDQMR